MDRCRAPSAPRAAAWTVAAAVLLMLCIGAWADANAAAGREHEPPHDPPRAGDVTNTTAGGTRGLRDKESRIIGGANVSSPHRACDSRDMDRNT